MSSSVTFVLVGLAMEIHVRLSWIMEREGMQMNNTFASDILQLKRKRKESASMHGRYINCLSKAIHLEMIG